MYVCNIQKVKVNCKIFMKQKQRAKSSGQEMKQIYFPFKVHSDKKKMSFTWIFLISSLVRSFLDIGFFNSGFCDREAYNNMYTCSYDDET